MTAADFNVRSGRRRLAAGLLGLIGFLGWQQAPAHGDITPQRGGLVAWAGEISVEVVLGDSDVTVYLDDHGAPLDAQGIEARLVAAPQGRDSFGLRLRHVKGNQLKGPTLELASGERFTVVLREGNGSVSVARFRAP